MVRLKGEKISGNDRNPLVQSTWFVYPGSPYVHTSRQARPLFVHTPLTRSHSPLGRGRAKGLKGRTEGSQAIANPSFNVCFSSEPASNLAAPCGGPSCSSDGCSSEYECPRNKADSEEG